MAGFFKGMQNILSGKPVFDAASPPSNESALPGQFQPQAQQPTEIPLVVVERIEYTERNNNEMSLNVHIKNRSNQTVTLQKIELLGNNRGLGIMLQAGGSREITEVYRGPLLPNTGNRHADLEYKGQNGDFFRTVHSLQYRQEASNLYGVVAARFETPIRRI